MQGNKHGPSSLVVKCTVCSIRKFEVDVGARPGVRVQRIKDRLHGALGGQLRHRGPHLHHVHQRDRDQDEVGSQDPGAKDQQPGHVRRQHPQKQHGGGGGNGAVATPGPKRFAHCLHKLNIYKVKFTHKKLVFE